MRCIPITLEARPKKSREQKSPVGSQNTSKVLPIAELVARNKHFGLFVGRNVVKLVKPLFYSRNDPSVQVAQ